MPAKLVTKPWPTWTLNVRHLDISICDKLQDLQSTGEWFWWAGCTAIFQSLLKLKKPFTAKQMTSIKPFVQYSEKKNFLCTSAMCASECTFKIMVTLTDMSLMTNHYSPSSQKFLSLHLTWFWRYHVHHPVTYPLPVVLWVSYHPSLPGWCQPWSDNLCHTTFDLSLVHIHKQMRISERTGRSNRKNCMDALLVAKVSTPLNKTYKFVLPQGVWFLGRHFTLKIGIALITI